ncbi:hypothetical protein AB0H34_09230 [Saccharopolyspora shandongensis]|uniref:hypothetical protein n=1 Tax=Saccharopolyspora shandongensis TaxID=418495 RepID=UPI0033DD5DD3
MDDIEFARRTDALIHRMRGRLQCEDIFFMPGPIPAGDHAMLLNLLLTGIGQGKVPISRRERDELRAILGRFELPVKFFGSINAWERIIAKACIIDDARITAAPGRPVVVHGAPDFDHALKAQVALHVGLPPQRYGAFVAHFAASTGVGVQVDLARTIPEQGGQYSRSRDFSEMEAKIAATLIMTISDCSIWGGGILLRDFEHWWTAARTDAETLIRQIPTILAAERYGGDTLHVALADVSPSTAQHVITTLTKAEVEASLDPTQSIPVFSYSTRYQARRAERGEEERTVDVAEFASRVDSLVNGMQDRLPEKACRFMAKAAEARDYDDVLEVLLSTLHKEQFPISQQEHDEFREIMERTSPPDDLHESMKRWRSILLLAEVIEPEPEPPGPPVIVHDDSCFDSALQDRVGLHVDLPPRLYEPFMEHCTAAGGVSVQLDMARAIPDRYSRDGEIRTPTSREADIVGTSILTIGTRSAGGGAVLLRDFEHWWTTARADAESLLCQFPTILAAERYGDDTFHIALADLSSSTVDQVIAILTESKVEEALGAVPPVPVFKYPPM